MQGVDSIVMLLLFFNVIS